MSNFDLRKFLAEGKLHEEMTSTEEAMDKPSKMKMSELKAKIRTEILAELSLNEDDDIDFGVGGEETQADVDFYEGLEEATKDGDGKVPAKDTDTDIDIKDEEEVEVDVKEKPKMSMKVDDNFLDQLEDLKDEADAIGDNKLERQIDNTITYFTRQHIAKDTNESLELEEAYDELEENLTKDQIQKKYNEMFGKNPQTKFADVAKALNTTEQEIAAALFSLPMLEADKDYYDAAERDDAAHIAALEKDMKDDKRSSMKESLEILKMKKLAGLITEGEYAKALLRENLDQELEAKIKSKIEDVMLEPDTKMIDGVLHVDFDVIGTLWMDTFEETFGREFDDVEGSDEDYNNFSKIQDISYNLLSNDGEIEVKYDY